MGGFINLIKKLFTGIFSFIGGIFGGKKSSSGYFLEAEPLPTVADSSSATAVAPSPAAAAAPSPATTDNSQKSTKAKSTKSTKSPQEKAPTVPATVPATVVTADMIASLQNSTAAAKAPQPVINFAIEAMTPKSTNGRRRPGANMSSYLAMAKEMKTL